MPWTGAEFKAKHAKHLTDAQAAKGAKIATAMIERGVDEGIAIATGIARAEGKKRKVWKHKRAVQINALRGD